MLVIIDKKTHEGYGIEEINKRTVKALKKRLEQVYGDRGGDCEFEVHEYNTEIVKEFFEDFIENIGDFKENLCFCEDQ